MFSIVILTVASCSKLTSTMSDNTRTNELIHETSPYLLQHAYNPVDWHPWGEKALKKAQKENKLLIISIGYSACHWCHVMEHESFEDSTVAAMMNEHFVSIKVDREERPDIDDIYMSAAQLVSGRGGWPLNAFALPDGRPIWAGTYFPKDRWMGILNQFADLKESDYERLESTADQLTNGIKSLDIVEFNNEPGDFDAQIIQSLGAQFVMQLDSSYGGREGAPKFPMPNNYEFLLKYADEYGDVLAKRMVKLTLDKMAYGGIYDQIGGGFARYSVDAIWKVPHFEKMLYDNTQLIGLYSQAYQYFKEPLYKRVVEQSIAFVERELRSSEGGFYSALDADSEGEEGKFYIWSKEEIDQIIPDPKERELVTKFYSLTEEGNWEHGQNILYVSQLPEVTANQFNMSTSELYEIIDRNNDLLLSERTKRERPGLDDKILTSFHALMIKAYTDAYRALGSEEYLENAIEAGHFILKRQMHEDGRLNRNYKNGLSNINGFLDDYAILVDALIALYEVTFDESWINVANDLVDHTFEHFFDGSNGMFHYTSDLDPPLVARKMQLSDNVIPASNSIMARSLHKLGELFYNEDYISRSKQMMKNIMPSVSASGQPGFYSNWLQGIFDYIHPPYEIAIVGPEADILKKDMMSRYTSNTLFLGSYEESEMPLLKNKYVEDKTLIYVCQNKTCKFPVDNVEDALKLMRDK